MGADGDRKSTLRDKSAWYNRIHLTDVSVVKDTRSYTRSHGRLSLFLFLSRFCSIHFGCSRRLTNKKWHHYKCHTDVFPIPSSEKHIASLFVLYPCRLISPNPTLSVFSSTGIHRCSFVVVYRAMTGYSLAADYSYCGYCCALQVRRRRRFH